MPHRKTCKRYNIPGHVHAITFSCFRRQAFLNRDRSRTWLIEALDRARTKHQFRLWAYVIMPEHAHIILRPTPADYQISTILSSIKQSVARRALVYVQRHASGFLTRMEDRQPNGQVHHRFWQRGGGYDRNILDPRTAQTQIAYIHHNPVRRDLVAKPEDWYWSSAAAHADLHVGPLSIDKASLPTCVESEN